MAPFVSATKSVVRVLSMTSPPGALNTLGERGGDTKPLLSDKRNTLRRDASVR